MLRDSNRMLYVTKLLGCRLESKAPNKTLGFPINLKIRVKIIMQVNPSKNKLLNKLAYNENESYYFIIMLALLLYY